AGARAAAPICTRVSTAGTLPLDAQAPPARHRRQLIRARAVPQLAGAVPAPAIRGPATRQPAGVIAAAVQGLEAQAAAHSHGRQSIRGRAVAQLALGVTAPAVGGTSASQATGVTKTGSQALEAQAAAYRHRRPSIGGRAVAQLAVDVVTPAVRATAARQATGVIAPRCHARPGHRRHMVGEAARAGGVTGSASIDGDIDGPGGGAGRYGPSQERAAYRHQSAQPPRPDS